MMMMTMVHNAEIDDDNGIYDDNDIKDDDHHYNIY